MASFHPTDGKREIEEIAGHTPIPILDTRESVLQEV